MDEEQKEQHLKDYKLAEVISVVSHQLKTPLSAIKGYIEVLLSKDLGKPNPKQEEYLKIILENTSQMIALVKDFLDVACIESDRMELKPTPIDLIKIVNEVIKELSLLAKARNCRISFETQGEIPLIDIDPIKIKQVIGNLINNAILYNHRKGDINVSLAQKNGEIIFSCQDTGIGMDEKEKGKIFSKFFRSERILVNTPRGSGLGLFISKAIVEKSGGKIWFESEKDKGSIFNFSLPIKNYGKN